MKPDISPLRILVKALCLFVIVNIVYALIDPQGSIVFGYNALFPGRTRLPFIGGGGPYSVAVDDVDAMFASHAISVRKEPEEYRVVLIGDSSIWGEGLGAHEMISEQWNTLNIPCGDEVIKTYNLGYPHPSVIKDLVILDQAMEYDPDLIVWFVTLNTLMSQRINPFLVANRERVAELLNNYEITFQQSEQFDNQPDFYEKTLMGQRSDLARQVRLEMLGILWAATGLDANVPGGGSPPDFKVTDNPRYRGMQPPDSLKDMLLFSALTAGHAMADSIPVLIVNEPIYVASGVNATVRYNVNYPRWAYDEYRQNITLQMQNSEWNYLDLWNVIPPEYFLEPGLHLGVEGERLLIEQINPTLQSLACNARP
ncbi:MAG: hypothetical protein EHM33_01490 [Chloroflexi bacterium]|nr:MAG: hypothetical protein EHM33_01490 [Chloroflexota bacterium]